MQKNQNKSPKVPEISEIRTFLNSLMNNTKNEISKATGYLTSLRKQMATIKDILKEVK